jgi:membrane protease subunit HflK
VVGKMSMDSAMAEERDQIAPRVRDLMQVILDRYKVGVEVVAVNMQQGGVRPPDQVKDAFDDVLKADQDSKRVKNEAEAYANQVVPLATGTAARLKQEADGYKARVVEQARGDAQRFASVLAEYQKAPQVTRDRMYLDAMRDIYGNIGKIIIDSKSGGSLMYLPLDKVMQAASASAAPAAAAPSAAAAPANPGADARARDNTRSRDRDSR